MGLLVLNDYYTLIRADVLDVVIEEDRNFIEAAEMAAEQEMSSYLNARYDVAALFRETKEYTISTAFAADDFVYLTAADFVAATVYAVGDLVTHTDGNVYKCIQITTGAEDPTNAAFFELWGLKNGFYTVINGGAGLKPADAAEFTAGDTRKALVVRYLIDLVLFELHSRINPRNIPDLRNNRRDDVITWLQGVANPRNDMSPDFPEKALEDQKGLDISWGQLDKTRNRY